MTTQTYSSYLKLDQLLEAQKPLSENEVRDETLFIVIHQVYELWFKQILLELNDLQVNLETHEISAAKIRFRRILKIFKTLVGQIDILETLSPVSFLAFRDRLDTASGFQSWQFRLLEARLGKELTASQLSPQKNEGHYQDLVDASKAPHLYDSFLQFLRHRETLSQKPLNKINRTVIAPNTKNQKEIAKAYRADDTSRAMSELMLDLDEGLMEWRYRHIRMVERTIGNKMGTGGSDGVNYLQTTLKPLFVDLWQLRSEL
jgi:tryptophan 2,3-dioxygenase